MSRNKKSRIIINISKQKMQLLKNDEILREYTISTSRFGIGNKAGSCKTPLGKHKICEKIGKNAPIGAIFKARKPTGEIADLELDDTYNEDLITTRIITLNGIEEGLNKGSGIDSNKRYIWIHGTAEESKIGKPASHGCIRMKNQDIVEFFDSVRVGMEIEIVK
ncbi:L,D-transpeptidase [Candidatus Cloacimonadota bacterium]